MAVVASVNILTASNPDWEGFVCGDCGWSWDTETDALAHTGLEGCFPPLRTPLPLGLRLNMRWRGLFTRRTSAAKRARPSYSELAAALMAAEERAERLERAVREIIVVSEERELPYDPAAIARAALGET